MLKNRHILVTRSYPENEALCQLLKNHGAITHAIATLAIVPRAVDFLETGDMAFFMSANAVRYAPIASFSGFKQYFSIGAATAAALKQRGVISEQGASFNSEGLLAHPDLQTITGKHIAIFCGQGGRDLLYQTLSSRGANCHRYEVYQRCCASQHQDALQCLLKSTSLDYVICTSHDNLLCLCKLAGPEVMRLYPVPLLVISQRIADLACQAGFRRVMVIENFYDNQSIVERIIQEER